MEIIVTRTDEHVDELEHHGTKGMKWGQRLYQNKDGSLTELGKRRYNKQVEKLKAEEAKIKEAEKVAKTKAKTQAKFDKLDAKKAELEERKKALKGTSDKDKNDKQEETVEQKRERLLKSTDPKELYADRDVLTYNELNDRLNRIDLENRLMNKIPVEHEKTAKDWMDKAKSNIDSASNLYKSVDGAFTTVKNSTIGKTVAKYMGIELPKDEKPRESLDDFMKNIDKKSDDEISKRWTRESNKKNLRDELERQNKKAGGDSGNNPNNGKNENQNSNKAKTDDDASQNSNKVKTEESAPKNDTQNKQDKQNKQTEPKTDKQSKKQADPEPEIIEPTKTKQKSSENSNKKKGEDISDYVEWKDVTDDDSPVRKSVNEVVKKSGSVELSKADYNQYAKDIKAWREKYDSEDSPYSQKQALDALYEIEKEYGISWRRLGEG